MKYTRPMKTYIASGGLHIRQFNQTRRNLFSILAHSARCQQRCVSVHPKLNARILLDQLECNVSETVGQLRESNDVVYDCVKETIEGVARQRQRALQ